MGIDINPNYKVNTNIIQSIKHIITNVTKFIFLVKLTLDLILLVMLIHPIMLSIIKVKK